MICRLTKFRPEGSKEKLTSTKEKWRKRKEMGTRGTRSCPRRESSAPANPIFSFRNLDTMGHLENRQAKHLQTMRRSKERSKGERPRILPGPTPYGNSASLTSFHFSLDFEAKVNKVESFWDLRTITSPNLTTTSFGRERVTSRLLWANLKTKYCKVRKSRSSERTERAFDYSMTTEMGRSLCHMPNHAKNIK